MRWLKRVAIVLGLLVLAALVTALIVARRSARVPDWYAAAREITVTKDLEDRQMIPIQRWADRTTAGDVRAKPPEVKRFPVTFTADDVNMLIAKWSQDQRIKQKIDAHVTNVRVRLDDGKIVIAGESAEYGRIISIVLQPGTDASGYATLALDSIRVGDVALPLTMMDDQKRQITGSLAKTTAKQRENLHIDDHGIATAETVNLYYTTLLSDLLGRRNADAYAFVYLNPLGGSEAVATRVRNLKIESGKMDLTLELLSPEQQAALLDQLRQRTTPASPN
jgi:hypothetical protein